jgi:hypothetical protein
MQNSNFTGEGKTRNPGRQSNPPSPFILDGTVWPGAEVFTHHRKEFKKGKETGNLRRELFCLDRFFMAMPTGFPFPVGGITA